MYVPCIVCRMRICQTIVFFDEFRGGKRGLSSVGGKVWEMERPTCNQCTCGGN
jgi:hypothetical protein